MAVSLCLAWLIDNQNQKLREMGIQRQERMMTAILILIMGFFCGLRTWGNDTVTYMQIYDLMPPLENLFDTDKYNFAGGTGFGLVTCLLKTWGFSKQDYLMFYAFATVSLYVWFVRKYSPSMVFGVFLMFTTGFYSFTMAAVKQCMATALCLVAIDAAVNRKWIRYLLMVFLASMFHPYALVYLLLPLLIFKPWSVRTVIYVVVFVAVGFGLERLLGTVLDVTDMMGASYDAEEFTGEGVNIFRVLVCFAPMVLAAVYGGNLFADSNRVEDMMFNIAMMNALIMFVGMFGTANYFARLANYFLPGQIVTIPWILRKFRKKDSNWISILCVVGYFGFFYYESGILRPFDDHYVQMSIWEYLASLF